MVEVTCNVGTDEVPSVVNEAGTTHGNDSSVVLATEGTDTTCVKWNMVTAGLGNTP